jgi:hypothetical protein
MNITSTILPKPPTFDPVKFEITCETLDELRVLWAYFNVSRANLTASSHDGSPGYGHITAAVARYNQSPVENNLFRVVNAALIEAGGKD